jgi:hypothetical protein
VKKAAALLAEVDPTPSRDDVVRRLAELDPQDFLGEDHMEMTAMVKIVTERANKVLRDAGIDMSLVGISGTASCEASHPG